MHLSVSSGIMMHMKNDWQWDRKLHIHTRGRDGSKEDRDRYAYEPTPYGVLQKLSESGWIGRNDMLLDYGCGKGRVGLFLNAQTGCRSIGIDFNQDMVRAAEKNLEKMPAAGTDVQFVWADAARYQVPDDATRFYFFNPFSLRILEFVMQKILESWYRAPREMLLLFYYPSSDYVGFLTRSEMLSFVDELDCSDLFPDDPRERILCFELI